MNGNDITCLCSSVMQYLPQACQANVSSAAQAGPSILSACFFISGWTSQKEQCTVITRLLQMIPWEYYHIHEFMHLCSITAFLSTTESLVLLCCADGKNAWLEEPLPWERRSEGLFYFLEMAVRRLTKHLLQGSINNSWMTTYIKHFALTHKHAA